MASNLQVVIELLLKNKKELDAVISDLKTKHGIDIDTTKADAAMKDLQNTTEQAAGKNSSLASTITAISTAYIAVSQAIAKVKAKLDELVNASNVQEDAEIRLAAALKNTGIYSEDTHRELKDYAAGLQDITRYGDEVILSSMALAQNIGTFTKDELKKVTIAAIGLSEAYGMDLNTSMNLIGRANKGQTQTLTRYGIVLDTTASKEEQFAQLLEQGAKKFELAKEAAKSGAGTLEQYKNQVGDLQEKFGDLFKMALIPVVNQMSEWVGLLDDALKKPYSDTLREEKIEFAALINILKNANTHQATRNEAIKILQEKYPDYIKNIDLEKASMEELGKVLKIANDEFQRKINMQAAEEILTKAKEKSVRETKKLIELEIKLEKLREDTEHRTFDYKDVVGELTFNIKNQTEKVKKLDEEYGDLFTRLTNQGLITEKTTKKIDKQTESVKGLGDELRALMDNAPSIDIIKNLDFGDILEDLDAADEAEFERKMAHQARLLALKGEFAQRGHDLNTSIYEQQLDAVDAFYERKKEELIAAGITEQEIVAQSEQAKDVIRSQYEARAVRGTSQMFDNIGKVMKSQGRAGFELWKKLAVAQAFGDTYKAANAAYAALAVINPILGALAAAAAIAAGLANVKQIESQKFGEGTVVEEETLATIGEKGPEAVVPLSGGRKIPVEMRGEGSGISNGLLQRILSRLDKPLDIGGTNQVNIVIEDKSDLVGFYRYYLDAKAEYERRGL